MVRTVVALLAVMAGLGAVTNSTQARIAPFQSSSFVAVQYRPGWNMAGGNPDSSLSSQSSTIVGYVAGAYRSVTPGRDVGLCQGYWALFHKPALIPQVGSAGAARSQSCPLTSGWNMIGNPFDGVALLPAGMTAYYWDPAGLAYVVVREIPLGASVWVYSDSSHSLQFQAGSEVAPKVTVTVPGAAPQVIAVGDRIAVTAHGEFPFVITADPRYLVFSASFIQDPGTPQATTVWHFHAVAAGSTDIDVSPACLWSGCAAPSYLLRVDISP